MSKKIIRILFPLIAFCCIFFLSCKEDEECRQERYVRMYAGFYTISTNTSTHVQSPVKLYIDTLSVKGVGIDSLLYKNAARKDSVRLPLNKFFDVSEFVFVFKDTITKSIFADTISVYYENHEDYLSFECGCLSTFTIDNLRTKTTNHYIDSIVINSKEVNTANVENIKIYHTPK